MFHSPAINRYILTAASCLKDPSIDASKILVSIKTHTQYEYTTNTLKVESFVAHPDFEEYKTNNVALIKLAEPVQIAARSGSSSSDVVSPICLPSFDPSESASDVNPLFVAGFGFTEGNNAAEQLNEVGVEEIESMKCLEQFKSSSGQFLNIKKLLCGMAETKGINQGDFGGPLAIRDGGQVYQAGIASYYFTNGQTGGKLFDVYERITPHVRWIKTHTEDANWCRAPAQAIQPAPLKSDNGGTKEEPKDMNSGSKNPVFEPPKGESSESNKNQEQKQPSSSAESEKKPDQGVVNPPDGTKADGTKADDTKTDGTKSDETKTNPSSSSESSKQSEKKSVDDQDTSKDDSKTKSDKSTSETKSDEATSDTKKQLKDAKSGKKESSEKSSEKRKVPTARDRWEEETKLKSESESDQDKNEPSCGKLQFKFSPQLS